MFDLLRRFRESNSQEMLKDLIAKKGAELIDVRTREEYDEGHVKTSKNIPVDEIPEYANQFNKEKPYVLVCASGMRSGNAVKFLKSRGFTQVYNGGSWVNFL